MYPWLRRAPGRLSPKWTLANVSIDLNGFSITTPIPQAQTSPSGGVFFTGTVIPSGITVRNGTIEGFLVPIELYVHSGAFPVCRNCVFEDLFLHSASGTFVNFDLGSYTRIHNVTAPDLVITVRCPSVGR